MKEVGGNYDFIKQPNLSTPARAFMRLPIDIHWSHPLINNKSINYVIIIILTKPKRRAINLCAHVHMWNTAYHYKAERNIDTEFRHNQNVAIMTWLAVKLKEHLFDKVDRCAKPSPVLSSISQKWKMIIKDQFYPVLHCPQKYNPIKWHISRRSCCVVNISNDGGRKYLISLNLSPVSFLLA